MRGAAVAASAALAMTQAAAATGDELARSELGVAPRKGGKVDTESRAGGGGRSDEEKEEEEEDYDEEEEEGERGEREGEEEDRGMTDRDRLMLQMLPASLHEMTPSQIRDMVTTHKAAEREVEPWLTQASPCLLYYL